MGKKVHITTFKDYTQKDVENFVSDVFYKKLQILHSAQYDLYYSR